METVPFHHLSSLMVVVELLTWKAAGLRVPPYGETPTIPDDPPIDAPSEADRRTPRGGRRLAR